MTTEATTKKRNTRRRGNGEGAIFQWQHGRWCAAVSNGYAADGKRRREFIYRETKKAVQEELTRQQNRKLDGTLAECGP